MEMEEKGTEEAGEDSLEHGRGGGPQLEREGETG